MHRSRGHPSFREPRSATRLPLQPGNCVAGYQSRASREEGGVKYLIMLAARSAWNRRLTMGLTLVTVALSVTLLLGVERIRREARESFAQSVSGTDLIVGA